MNICILSTRYPYKGNMVHVFVKKLVDEWAKLGHHCVVISPVSKTKILLGKEVNMPYYEKQEVASGIFVEVYRPRFWHLPNIRLNGVSATSMSLQRTIDDTITKAGVNFDFIYGHFFDIASRGWSYAHKHRVPLFVATGESLLSLPSKPCKEFTIDKFRQELCGVVAVSTKNKVEAAELGLIDPTKTKVFPNGANLDLFTRLDKVECRKKLGLPIDSFIVICVGQFIERKGQRRILQALDLIGNNKIKTIFIGKGPDTFEHDNILFKGVVENSQLPYYLNSADAFVLPTRHEGCCNAIIEALACGLPIISSDLPFNHDVLSADNAILVDPDNIEEIAKGIETLLKDKTLRDKLTAESFNKGQQLSIVTRSSNILDFIKGQIAKQNE